MEQLKIDISPGGRYVCFNDILGRGAYKIVYRGYDKHNGIEVAWNSISIEGLSESEKTSIINEINILKELSPQCSHIINFHNAWINENRATIVFITEIALSGTLYDYIKKINLINLRVIKSWCRKILEALNFLHSKNIAHRDLKCTNIFINSNTGDVFIGDFGLANKMQTNFHSMIGTPEYMAPEMYEEKYNEKVDIYAFGMCLLEMITKEVPYSECVTFGQIFRKVQDGVLPKNIDKINKIKAKNIILSCISRDPNDRPSAEDLLNDPFFRTVEKEDHDENLTINDSSKVVEEQKLVTKIDSVEYIDKTNSLVAEKVATIIDIDPNKDVIDLNNQRVIKIKQFPDSKTSIDAIISTVSPISTVIIENSDKDSDSCDSVVNDEEPVPLISFE